MDVNFASSVVDRLIVNICCALCMAPMVISAATIINGTASGTWTPSGNPYVIGTYTEVSKNNSLTIKPGVEVVIGPNVEFRISGLITAVGTYEAPVIFRGASSPNYWERIYITKSGSRFDFCVFSEAKIALHYYVGPSSTMEANVLNSTFMNCLNQGIYVQARAGSHYTEFSNMNISVINCVFDNAMCDFCTSGGNFGGVINPIMKGNVFSGCTNSAVRLRRSDSNGSGGLPQIINNVFVDCNKAIDNQLNAYDVVAQNNIFAHCSNAVTRVNANSLNVQYNCFYNNTVNFVGYDSTFGLVIWSNENGDPCDLFYNIFLDPQFEADSFVLSSFSPCIDAGDPSVLDYYDPVQGSSISDMGAYGGAQSGAGIPPSPPVIIKQPDSQTVFLGQDVTFEVDAVGYDLHYQWFFAGSALTGETGSTLELKSVDFADAGNYYCSISNVYDVVDSSHALLKVTEIGLTIEMHPGLHMTNLVAGTEYSIQRVYSLSDTNWVEISSFEATENNAVWYDPESTKVGRKFYKVERKP